MTDSSEFTSLFALVDSHLSKTSLQDTGGTSNTASLNIPSLSSLRNGSASESLLSMHTRPRIPIPTLSSNENEIQSILARQVANMLIAREKKQQEEEKAKLEVEMKKLQIEDEDNYLIDLTQAIQTPYNPRPQIKEQETLSNSSSFESLFKLNFTDCEGKPQRTKTPEPLLPCMTDISYILKEKVKLAKCSSFGKVLTSQLTPVPALYFPEKYPTDIARFDFSTPSPSDIIKENLRKPT
ncbi:jg55, partial [Pararge aegeria aegeria]